MADAPLVDFDVAGARSAGYSDDAIADYLAKQANFDLAGARKAGYSADQVIGFLAPQPQAKPQEPPPAPPEAPPSSMAAGVGKAAGQEAMEFAGRVVAGRGAQLQALGGLPEADTQRQIDIARQIDQGATMRDFKDLPDTDRLFAREYQVSSPERRQKVYQDLLNQMSPLERPVAEATKRVGQQVSEAGHALQQSAERTFPLTPEEQGRFTVKATKALTGLGAYVGTAALTGMPGVMDLAATESFGTTYDEAKSKGATDQQAAQAAFLSGVIQGGLTAVPVHQAANALDRIPLAFRGQFMEAALEAVKSSGTLLTFSQLSTLADNVIAKNTYDPARPVTQGMGENLLPTAVAGAVLPVVGAGARGAVRRFTRTPEETGAKVMDAPDVDSAIDSARKAISQPELEQEIGLARNYGTPQAERQADILQLFGGLNSGQIERDAQGAYFYRDHNDQSYPLQEWNGRERPDTMRGLQATAIRDTYARAGVRVIFVEDQGGRIPFDGAVDPAQPDTIFVSSNPQRAAGQVAAHEFTHLLESTTLPDGRALADVLHDQIRAGITPQGLDYAKQLFGPTAPERGRFAEGPEGDALHADAVLTHLVKEMGADIGAEAPRFDSFMPRVVDAVQERYGFNVARETLARVIDGIRAVIDRIRQIFNPALAREYGPPPTVSQNWVSNLDQIHDTLAKMYAQRFGGQAGLQERAPEPQRALPAPALVTPPPRAVTPETVFQPQTYGQSAGTAPARPTGATGPSLAEQRDAILERVIHRQNYLKGKHGDDIEGYRREAETDPTLKRLNDQYMELLKPPFKSRDIATKEAPEVGAEPVAAEIAAKPREPETTSPLKSQEIAAEVVQPEPRAPEKTEAEKVAEVQAAIEQGGTTIDLNDTSAFKKALEIARQEKPEPTQLQKEQAKVKAMKGGWTEIGKNYIGQTLYEDARGVRSIVENGVRRTEPVRLGPPGSGEISVDRTDRPEYQLAEPHPTREDLKPEYREPERPSPDQIERTEEAEAAATGSEPRRPPQADHEMADVVTRMLVGGEKISAGELQRHADRIYGGTLASGAYSRDRLYDAIELGVNQFIQRRPRHFDPRATTAPVAKAIAEELARLKDRLPTQTVRAGEKDAYQQFSTPPDYAYAANWVANLRPSDHVLEPSAGVGGLIVHAMNAGVRETTVNELSDKRRGMIEALNPSRVTGEDAAQLHNILPDSVRPTVVVMNPPFSRAAERMGGKMVLDEGAKHIEQALQRLEPGGRLVAIVGDGMKPEGTVTPGSSRGQGTGKAFADWWRKIGAEYDVRANIGVDRGIYSKYGTAFPTRLLVIDKNAPSGRPMVTGQAKDAAGIIDLLQGVHDDRGSAEPRGAVEQVAGEPGRAPLAASGEGAGRPTGELPRPAGAVGTGERPSGGAGPEGTEPAGAAQRGEHDRPAAAERPPGSGLGDKVHPIESRDELRGTDELPAGRPEPGREPDERIQAGGGDGVRPDGSGERELPGVSEAPDSVIKTEAAVTEPESRELTESIYEPYRPQVTIKGAKAHPGALVQSAAMETVRAPTTDYRPNLPKALIEQGSLSDAQLEAVIMAGHAHSDVMPDGKRRGFFIGDGTGVGKGREIAGIILDNFRNGRKKAVWLSEKPQLMNDAQRDWNGLGQPKSDIFLINKIKAGEDIKATKGILFASYSTLRSAEQTKVEGNKVKGQTRVDQIVKWLGKDFDGVIVFDEAHNMGNSTDEKVAGRGTKKAAQQAVAGIKLQDALPNARVVYVSATGATDTRNLAYLDRLGLWGEGTSFAKRDTFVGEITKGGVAAMELVARDMKALGHYISRNLSFDGVDYDRVEHRLTSDQRVVYDKLAEGWQTVLRNFEAALEITGATEEGKSTGGREAMNAKSAFWGAHQRFFNQIITSMQMPAVLRGVEKDIKEGRQAVLQLVNTMEAAQERALESTRKEGAGELDDLDMTPRQQLMQLIEKSFPVQQIETAVDEHGNEFTRPAKDSNGNPVLNKQAVAMRDRLLDEIGSIRVPDGPLEILLNHFGTDKVAEVTGRGQRVVRKPDENGQIKSVIEKRGAAANIAEANQFQEGKKPILVFSAAGGTGRSYHAAIGSGSEGARRSHYLVQGGWKADAAVQGFGRTHRTNQASAPIFHLVTTDLQGQKRFISSIARRLAQLGALTKGERRAGDQGLFGRRDNLESTEALLGLSQLVRDVVSNKVEGVTTRILEEGMGLKLYDAEGKLVVPKMTQFLNRVLSLKIDDQNRVFEAFSERMDQAIDRAAAAGTLDVGTETYKADKLTKVSEQTVYTDPRSGAETKHVHLNAQNRNYPKSFDDTLAGRNKTNGKKPDAFVQNEQSGRVYAVTPAGDHTDADGRVTAQLRLTSPTDYQLIERFKVEHGGNWKTLTEEQARPLWDKQVAETPEYRSSDLHLITGAVLPIWDRLGGSPQIYRLQTDKGERMLGRVIPSTQVNATLQRLGAEGIKVTAKPADVVSSILRGATAELSNEWKIKRSMVAGEPRLELIGPDFSHAEELKRAGVFSERIAYQTRYFIPTAPEAAAKAIERITKNRPVTSLSGGEGPAFSPRLTGDSGRQYTPEERQAFDRVGRITNPETLREKVDNARDDIGRKLIRETLDAYVGLKGNDPEGYMAARLANSVAGAQEVFRLYGTLKFDGSTYNYRDLNGGVRGLVKALGPEAHDFLWWVAANRAERLKAEDRENLFSTEDIATLKRLNRGQLAQDYRLSNGNVTRSREAAYTDALRRYDGLNKSVLDLVTESGLVKRETVDQLWADPFYVPFYREAATEGASTFATPRQGFVRQYAAKRLKGGAEKLRNDLWENAFGNWDHMIDAALRNRAASQILDTSTRLGAAETVTTQDYNYRMTKAEKAETVWVMKDGKQQFYRVTDPMVFKAVSALETTGRPGPIMAVAKWFSRALRYGVTANPLFAVRNLIRDTENTISVSGISKNPFKNLADGFRQIDVGDRLKNVARAVAGQEAEAHGLEPEAISAMAGGALMRLGAASDAGIARTTILDNPGRLQAFKRYIADVAGTYKEALASGEDVNRLALYHQLREQGAPHDFAAFSARDLQDFTLHGASPFVRAITDITPFLGARLQGLYKLGRAASDADRNIAAAVGGRVARNLAIRAATVMGAMTLAGLALDAIYHDDEDYKKRTEYDRQTYYWFKIGNAQFRIPKGFELAALSSLATDGIEAFFDKEMTGQRWINNFWMALSTNLQVQAPALVQPAIDVMTNTRGTGGPIETAGMERLEPQERYTADTTLIARGLSSVINAGLRMVAPRADGPSPVQIDYLANAYGGWLATSVLGMADTAVRAFSSEPERPAQDFWAQATQGLVRVDTAPQSRYVDMLYEQGKQIEQAHATFLNLVKLGRGEEAKEFAQDRRQELAQYPAFERVKRLETEINQQIRVISNDMKLSGEQKRVKIMQLQSLKNRAAEGLFTGASP